MISPDRVAPSPSAVTSPGHKPGFFTRCTNCHGYIELTSESSLDGPLCHTCVAWIDGSPEHQRIQALVRENAALRATIMAIIERDAR